MEFDTVLAISASASAICAAGGLFFIGWTFQRNVSLNRYRAVESAWEKSSNLESAIFKALDENAKREIWERALRNYLNYLEVVAIGYQGKAFDGFAKKELQEMLCVWIANMLAEKSLVQFVVNSITTDKTFVALGKFYAANKLRVSEILESRKLNES